MSRPERLQLIISLMRTSPGMRPAELAARCQVSERSIFRDLHTLHSLGLPVYFDRGYRLPSPTFLPPLHLTGEEAIALSIAATREADRHSPLGQALLSARSKLALRLAPASPVPGGQMPLALPEVPPHSTEASIVFSVLQEAMATGRRVTIRHAKSERSRPRSLEVRPRHLSLQENGWVLLADDAGKGRGLAIRLEQIKGATMSGKKGGRSRSAKRAKTRIPLATGLRVKLRLRSPLSALGSEQELPSGVQVEERDGGVILLMSHASGMRELLGWLLSFGPAVEVIEPVALRAELRQIVSELSALYGAEP